MSGSGLRSLPFVDVGGPTIGFVAVGGSAFVLLASGPRLLGHDEFSVLAIAWTLATILGIGIGSPGEQTVTRVTAAGGGPTVSAAVQRRLAVVAAVTLLLPLLALTGHAPLLGGSVLWGGAVVVAAVGWALLAGPRGRLAAARDFTGYTRSLVAEAVARTALCVLAWAVPSVAAPALAAAVGLPVVVSALVARRRASTAVPAAAAPTGAHGSEQSYITAVALLGQVAINTAPLWLSARATDAALAGQYVSATSYLRIPLFLVGGLGTVALSAVSGAFGVGDLARARRTSERSAATAALVGLVSVAVLLLVSGPALHLLYGSAVDLATGTLAAVAVTTVLLMTANVLSLVCFGCDRSRAVAGVWLVVAVGTTLGLAVRDWSTLGVAVVTGIGQAVAVLGLSVVAARALRRGRAVEPEPPTTA